MNVADDHVGLTPDPRAGSWYRALVFLALILSPGMELAVTGLIAEQADAAH